jgi:hypothetical protein
MNILRESNSTLRRENQANLNKMKKVEGLLEAEKAKIAPLEGKFYLAFGGIISITFGGDSI